MRFHALEKYTKISGRTLYRNDIRFLGYSGTSVSFRFIGKKAVAHILSDTAHFEEFHRAWAAVFINGSITPNQRFCVNADEADYILYESETAEEVTITLMKYSEPEYAPLGIKWIETDSASLLAPPEPRKRKIQIIGDSITCGYGVEGSLREPIHRTSTENPCKAYSLLTAQALNAELELIAWNGKGVITEYVGEEDNLPHADWLVPMLYEYTDAGCERDVFHTAKKEWEKWDHSSYQPDLVLINLGTNDASYTRDIPERSRCFKNAYLSFLKRIHDIHPNAKILCVLGTMDQRLCSTVAAAVNTFQEDIPDTKNCAEFLSLPPQKEEDGFGTFWHPTAVTQKKTADLITEKIRKLMNWND